MEINEVLVRKKKMVLVEDFLPLSYECILTYLIDVMVCVFVLLQHWRKPTGPSMTPRLFITSICRQRFQPKGRKDMLAKTF